MMRYNVIASSAAGQMQTDSRKDVRIILECRICVKKVKVQKVVREWYRQ